MKAKCDFCYRECTLSEGQRGICHIRVNRDGAIVTENYGEVVALALDPIEKKPLYHFRPGSRTLSVALFGCNLFCSFCQNYSISQNEFYQRRPSRYIPPNVFVQQAIEEKVSVSFTYSEPIVWQDYLLDAPGWRRMPRYRRFSFPAERSAGLPCLECFHSSMRIRSI